MKGVADLVSTLSTFDRSEFSTSWWSQRVEALESVLWTEIPEEFLLLPEVADCGIETHDLKASYEEQLEMISSGYAPDYGSLSATPTDITHAYHLWRAGWPKKPEGALVEWGGGFGNMARLTRLYALPPLHIIIDTPVMLALQRAFLGSCGIEASVVVSPPQNVDRGVWLVPNGCGGVLESVAVDTFIGTFSVSECTPACHDYLIDRAWFDARSVFLAVDPDKNLFPEAMGLADRLRRLGFREEPTHFPPSLYFVSPA